MYLNLDNMSQLCEDCMCELYLLHNFYVDWKYLVIIKVNLNIVDNIPAMRIW